MSERRLIFFSSDWHIGHHKVIEYSKRPFRDVNHMREVLVNNYNSTVPTDGICYFLGDMGLCQAEHLTAVVKRLNGTKILILGNHDKGPEAMYKIGFSAVMNSAALYIANARVELNHCPPRGAYREDTTNMRGSDGTENWHGERRHDRFTRDYSETCFWLHGHTHKSNRERILNRMFDVGVDANNYTPVSISQIESWVGRYGR